MTFNAARQPFALSAVASAILAALFAMRYRNAPYPAEAPFTEGMPPAAAITQLSVQYPWIAAASVAVVLLWILFILIQLTIRYTSITSRNYLSIQFFLIAACGIIVPGEALVSYMAALLLLLSVRQFVSTFHKEYRFEESLRAGLYTGLLPLLYAPAALLLLLVPVAMSLYRRSSRELTVCTVGALLPVTAAGFIYWTVGESPAFIYTEIWRCAVLNQGLWYTVVPWDIPITGMVCVGLLLLLAIAAVFWYVPNRKGTRTKQRKVMAHVSFMLPVTLALLALPGSTTTGIPLAAVAVSMAAPYAFSGKLTIPASVIYCLILVAVLALNLSPFLGVSIP